MNFIKNARAIKDFAGVTLRTIKNKKEIDEAKSSGSFDLERKLQLEKASSWGQKLVEKFGIALDVKGEENMPVDFPAVYISDHQSYLDIVVLYAVLKSQAGFIAKAELEKVPVIGKWVGRMRGIYIKRGNPKESLKTIKQGCDYLKSGFSMIIFPEGTRSKSHEMAHFKPGSFKLATRCGMPIIPVTIDGTCDVFEIPGVITPGVTVHITFHEKVETAGLSREEQLKLPEKVESIVRSGFEKRQ